MDEYRINKTDFFETMNLQSFDLPLEWDGNDFRQSLKNHYDNYLTAISAVLPPEIINQIKKHVSDEILYTIDKYYIGFPHLAYRRMNKVLKFLMQKPLKTYQKSQHSGFLREMDSLKLFRIRHVDSDQRYYRQDIFHTPFHLRSNIGSCRYSISGYPSLYLATNLPLCVQETIKKDNNQETIASRFSLVRNEIENGNIPIKVLELAVKPSDFIIEKNSSLDRSRNNLYAKRIINEIDLGSNIVQLNYLFWYPLIAACSYIRAKKTAMFNPEFIIPQLLMQWIRVHSEPRNLIGIRYFSCANIESSDMGFNYVFPVYSTPSQSQSGYCKILRRAFELTSPVFLHKFPDIEECEMHLIRDNELETIDVD